MPASDERRTAMLDLVRRWQESGLKARAFAQEHGVTPWTLYYWRERLATPARSARTRRRTRVRPAKKATLVPVRILPQETSEGLELILTNGDRIRVPSNVAVDRLRQVVQVMRTAC